MRTTVLWSAAAALTVVLGGMAACAPSQAYREGRGFFSDSFTETQVREATAAGKVTRLDRFTVEASSCGNYSAALADRNIIASALGKKLPEIGANAAEHIAAVEPAGYFWFSTIVLWPMGCGDWTVTGDALLVDMPAPAVKRE